LDFLKKKGIMFTFVSLMMAAFFITLFSSPIDLPLDAAAGTISFRISLIDRFKQSWEDYAGNALRVSSHRALDGLSQHMRNVRTGPGGDMSKPFFSSASEFARMFEECLVDGNITRPILQPDPFACPGMGSPDNATLTDWLNEISRISLTELGINTTFIIRNVSIYQKFPFHVFVELNVSYTIQDTFATIARNITLIELVPIGGVTDPLASGILQSGDNVRDIIDTNITSWSAGNLSNFVESLQFRYNNDGPAFLGRYTRNLSGSSCCGIETVLSDDLDSLGNSYENSSYVDYLYFIDQLAGRSIFACNDTFTVINFPILENVVFLDQLHLAAFNVSSDQWRISCTL